MKRPAYFQPRPNALHGPFRWRKDGELQPRGYADLSPADQSAWEKSARERIAASECPCWVCDLRGQRPTTAHSGIFYRVPIERHGTYNSFTPLWLADPPARY